MKLSKYNSCQIKYIIYYYDSRSKDLPEFKNSLLDIFKKYEEQGGEYEDIHQSLQELSKRIKLIKDPEALKVKSSIARMILYLNRDRDFYAFATSCGLSNEPQKRSYLEAFYYDIQPNEAESSSERPTKRRRVAPHKRLRESLDSLKEQVLKSHDPYAESVFAELTVKSYIEDPEWVQKFTNNKEIDSKKVVSNSITLKDLCEDIPEEDSESLMKEILFHTLKKLQNPDVLEPVLKLFSLEEPTIKDVRKIVDQNNYLRLIEGTSFFNLNTKAYDFLIQIAIEKAKDPEEIKKFLEQIDDFRPTPTERKIYNRFEDLLNRLKEADLNKLYNAAGETTDYDTITKKIDELRELKNQAEVLNISTEGLGFTILRQKIQDTILIDFWKATGWKNRRVYSEDPTQKAQEIRELFNDSRVTSRVSVLKLGYKGLFFIPPEIGNFTNLQNLNLGNNNLKALPSEIGYLTSLRKLWLENNQLQTLPSEFGNLTSLQELWFFQNQLQTLPSEFGNLTSLTELRLDDNRLQTLPPEFGNLTSLYLLSLNYNQLQTLPPEFGNLTSLRRLSLEHNKFQTLPVEIISQLKSRGAEIYLYKATIPLFLGYSVINLFLNSE